MNERKQVNWFHKSFSFIFKYYLVNLINEYLICLYGPRCYQKFYVPVHWRSSLVSLLPSFTVKHKGYKILSRKLYTCTYTQNVYACTYTQNVYTCTYTNYVFKEICFTCFSFIAASNTAITSANSRFFSSKVAWAPSKSLMATPKRASCKVKFA